MGKTLNRVELVGIGVNEQVVREKWKFDLLLLPVLPYPDGLNHRPEYFIVKIRKSPVNPVFCTRTQVKNIPFLFTCGIITGYAQLIFTDYIFPAVSQCKGF